LIVVAGEALIDQVLQPGGTVSSHLGGAAFNAARTLGRLGRGPRFVGRLSTDASGRRLRSALEESGVELGGIVTTAHPTTIAVAELDASGIADYRFCSDGTSVPGLRQIDARRAMPASVTALLVGGLGLVFEPQATAIAALVAAVGEQTLVMVDLNCRPDAIKHPQAYRARLDGVLRRADVVKASEEDLGYLEPDLFAFEAARRVLSTGPAVMLLSHGAGGTTVLSESTASHVRAPSIKVVDTIGAGDAFVAGWLAFWSASGLGRGDLSRHETVVKSARFAADVAALTCTRAGAEPPTLAELGLDRSRCASECA
jgi:fructokinase